MSNKEELKELLDPEKRKKRDTNSILEVVLLCKGHYDQEKYPTIIDALKQYYHEYYCCPDYEKYFDEDPERLLTQIIFKNTMQGIINYYPDRMYGFINIYILDNRTLWNQTDWEGPWFKAIFNRLLTFFQMLQLHGDGYIDMDDSDYIGRDENGQLTLIKDIIH